MGAREDLLTVGASLAQAAASGKPITHESTRVAALAHGAKAALEAAALVDADPAPIFAAAERLELKLSELGVETDLGDALGFADAAGAIEAVADVVGGMVAVARENSGLRTAYQRLHETCEALEVDFGAADTETAKRIAARLRTAREDAEQAMQATTRQEG